jgi:hypothetical protein
MKLLVFAPPVSPSMSWASFVGPRVTRAMFWVSPRWNIAEPCTRGRTPTCGLERAERLCIAVVGADALGENGRAVGLVLEILEDDVEVDISELALAEFRDEGGLGFLLELLHVGGADVLLEAEDGGGNALARGRRAR